MKAVVLAAIVTGIAAFAAISVDDGRLRAEFTGDSPLTILPAQLTADLLPAKREQQITYRVRIPEFVPYYPRVYVEIGNQVSDPSCKRLAIANGYDPDEALIVHSTDGIYTGDHSSAEFGGSDRECVALLRADRPNHVPPSAGFSIGIVPGTAAPVIAR